MVWGMTEQTETQTRRTKNSRGSLTIRPEDWVLTGDRKRKAGRSYELVGNKKNKKSTKIPDVRQYLQLSINQRTESEHNWGTASTKINRVIQGSSL